MAARSSRIRALTITAGGPSCWPSLPALLLLTVWNIGSSVYLERHIHAALPERTADSPSPAKRSPLSLVKSLANGLRRLDRPDDGAPPSTFAELQPLLAAKGVALASDTQDYMIPIAVEANKVQDRARPGRRRRLPSLWRSPAPFMACGRSRPRARARNNVEKLMLWGLLGASTIAILTTVGIVLSMLFQTISFFESVPLTNFFFGTVWDPRFAAAGSGGSGRPVRPYPAARRHALHRPGRACWSRCRSG